MHLVFVNFDRIYHLPYLYDIWYIFKIEKKTTTKCI